MTLWDTFHPAYPPAVGKSVILQWAISILSWKKRRGVREKWRKRCYL